jgi:hypothetical protein
MSNLEINASWIREALEDYGCEVTYCSECDNTHEYNHCQGND